LLFRKTDSLAKQSVADLVTDLFGLEQVGTAQVAHDQVGTTLK
jgi:hypothetical protein